MTNITQATVITDPGKFEGEPTYAVYYWDSVLNGFADCEFPSPSDPDTWIAFFKVSAADRQQYPELATIAGIALWEDSVGFVHSTTFGTLAEYHATIARYAEEV